MTILIWFYKHWASFIILLVIFLAEANWKFLPTNLSRIFVILDALINAYQPEISSQNALNLPKTQLSHCSSPAPTDSSPFYRAQWILIAFFQVILFALINADHPEMYSSTLTPPPFNSVQVLFYRFIDWFPLHYPITWFSGYMVKDEVSLNPLVTPSRII